MRQIGKLMMNRFNKVEIILKPARKFKAAFDQRWAKIRQFLQGASNFSICRNKY